MVGDPTSSSIRNAVAFESFVDLRIGHSREFPDKSDIVIHRALQGVHHAIVSGARLAVAFPELRIGPERSLGGLFRMFGAPVALETALRGDVLHGLGLSGLLRVGPVLSVPDRVEAGVAYVRARPDRFLPGTWDRMDRRTRARRKAGRSIMDEEDIAQRRLALAQRGRETVRLPSFCLSSGSTGRRYPVYVQPVERDISSLRFTSYGLSDGAGAVPHF